MIRSLRARLTAWYLAFFSLLFVLFSLYLYGVLSNALRDRLDESLRAEMGTAADMFADELDEAKGDVATAASETASGMRVRDTLVAVVGDGLLLAASDPSRLRETGSIAGLVAEPPGDEQVVALPQFGPYGARAVVRRVPAGTREVLVIALARLDPIMAELLVVRRVIFIGLPLLLALAGLGGYLVAAARAWRRSAGWRSRRAASAAATSTRAWRSARAAEELEAAGGLVQRTAGAAGPDLRQHAPLRGRRLARVAHAPSPSSAEKPTWRCRRNAPPPPTAKRWP